MARDFFINGESMVSVRGAAGTSIATVQQLGLADSPIVVTLDGRYLDVIVNAWGTDLPAEVQYMLSSANISMTLVHVDRSILDVCLQESMGGIAAGGTTDGGGVTTPGQVSRAGARLGNNAARFAATNHYISLGIQSPVASKPWTFYYTYLTGPPMEHPLGVERSIIRVNFRAIAFTNDPWGGGTAQPNTVAGTGAKGAKLWEHSLLV